MSAKLFSQSEYDFSTDWNHYLKFESADKAFQIKMGGRIHFDMMFIGQEDSLSNHFLAENGAEFRRVRLFTAGKLYQNVEFKVQLDFAKGVVVLKDVYLRVTKLPVVGNFQVGNFKEPMGFEMITSSNNITEMERSLTDALTPDRNLGLMVFNQWAKKRVAAFAGFFYPSMGGYKYQGNAYHLTGRLVGVPVYKTEGNYQVLHLGVSYSQSFNDGQALEYLARPESHLAPKYVSVNYDAIQDVNKMGAELVYVYNQFSFQSEFMKHVISPAPSSALAASTYVLDVWYGILSWVVTGEHKPYHLGSGSFDGISPHKNFGKDGGIGAWEVSLRYSEINLDDHEIHGGRMRDITLGVNWFLNPVTRISANYISSDVVGLGRAGIFQMRFQLTF